MKRILACLFVGGLAAASFATDARILGLGRHDAFFMDDYSIFRNPANINIYPNMLIGSLGYRVPLSEALANANLKTKNDSDIVKQQNRDPAHPYVGGVLSYSFNQSSEAGSQYPMLSIGIVANRYDDMLGYVLPNSPKFHAAYDKLAEGHSGDTISKYLPVPVGKFDVMAGYAFKSGGMIGLGGYFAFQNGGSADTLSTSLFKGTAGVNWPIAKSTDLEASVGIGAVTAVSVDTLKNLEKLADFKDNHDFAFNGDVRLFSALTMINGDFVPHLGVNVVNLQTYSFLQIALGMGVNLNVDKGFGWGGLEFIHEQSDDIDAKSITRGTGARLSFGFERTLWVDYFLLRGGLSKKLLYVTDDAGQDGRWTETAEANGSDNDMVGVGFGLNVENRLKIDVVVSEDLFYTVTNLISEPQDHLFTRLTFTYSF